MAATASVPALTAAGPVGWVILGVGAIAVLGIAAYETGFFDTLKEDLDALGDWLLGAFDKVVDKAKSIFQEIDIGLAIETIEGVAIELGDNILYSKGGRQNVRDTGLAGKSDGEILDGYNNSSGAEKKRYEKELKGRGLKNKRKREDGKRGK